MARGLRWRVAILDDHERSRAALRGAIWAAGGEVVGEALRCADAVPLIERASPDAAIFAVGLPDGDGIEAAAHVIATTDCPVVLFTSHTGDDFVERARAAGVMAYLLKPLRPAELAPRSTSPSRASRRTASSGRRSKGGRSSSARRACSWRASGSPRRRRSAACAVRRWTVVSPWWRSPERCSSRSQSRAACPRNRQGARDRARY